MELEIRANTRLSKSDHGSEMLVLQKIKREPANDNVLNKVVREVGGGSVAGHATESR